MVYGRCIKVRVPAARGSRKKPIIVALDHRNQTGGEFLGLGRLPGLVMTVGDIENGHRNLGDRPIKKG